MELHFKDISGKDSVGDFTWIHQSGKQAILIDMVSSGEVEPGLNEIKLWLAENQETDVFNHESLLKDIHEILISNNAQAAFAVITENQDSYECYSVGNLRFYQVGGLVSAVAEQGFEVQPTQVLGQKDFPDVHFQTFSVQNDELFLITSDGLNSEWLLAEPLTSDTLKSGDLYRTFLPGVQEKDWSILMFPMSRTQSYIHQNWPYNPFVGAQEERFHERRGLAELASSLFAIPQFNGFRIVACPPVLTANSSRLFDGLLVYPFGVIPIELKDHHGQISLDIDSRNGMSVYNEMGQTRFANPVHKLREGLRPFADLFALKPLDPLLKNAGVVVFTSPKANVLCEYNGSSYSMPFSKAGEVMVANTASFAEMLLKHCKARFGKKLKSRLDESDINHIIKILVEEAPINNSQHIRIDDYECSQELLMSESTDYYQIHEAWDCGEKSWAKVFSFDHLSSVKREAEIDSIGRESRILKRLRKVSGVQDFLGKSVSEDNLYIFLEAAPEQRLTAWLKTGPSREERLTLLIRIAEILRDIQHVGSPDIIHRAINPNNIRVDEKGQPLLINFELCQFEYVATLPITARRTFEQKFQASEVNQPGQTLTYAADIYSLGLLAFLLLTDELPFKESSKELLAKGRRPAFWASLCQSLNIPASNAEFIQRILHNVPNYRPDITNVIEVFESWKA